MIPIKIEVGTYTVFNLPPYFFFAGLGLTVSVCCYMLLLLKSNTNISKKNLLLFIITILGIMFGARLFGCLTNIAIKLYNHEKIDLSVIYKAGLVYYGGLIGAVCFYLIGIRILFRNQNKRALINALAVSIPLFHFFGRIGCLFAGCCYGKEYHGNIHVDYIRDGVSTETFPIQTVESLLELCIFSFLLIIYCRHSKQNNINLLVDYFLIYSVGRFFIEFYRGDINRGEFGIFSFSQIISIGLFLFNIFFLFTGKVKNENY